MSNLFMERRARVVCPHCAKPDSTVEHLMDGQSFGPWYCDSCNKSYTGKIENGNVTLESTEALKRRL